MWKLLNETVIADNLALSLINIRQATAGADKMVKDMHTVITDMKNGKGSLGMILADTTIAYNLNEAVLKIKQVGDNANELASEMARLTAGVKNDINNGKGPINALLRDSALVIKLNNSISSIEKGTEAFNQNMEALKHNILLRGYFRKQEKKQKDLGAK
ncbi:MAG: hypothetical protein IPH18_17535 [Chitinophagaceae bacterium]|nr:hypothetical protein [Chitinophagaceae bacterium]